MWGHLASTGWFAGAPPCAGPGRGAGARGESELCGPLRVPIRRYRDPVRRVLRGLLFGPAEVFDGWKGVSGTLTGAIGLLVALAVQDGLSHPRNWVLLGVAAAIAPFAWLSWRAFAAEHRHRVLDVPAPPKRVLTDPPSNVLRVVSRSE